MEGVRVGAQSSVEDSARGGACGRSSVSWLYWSAFPELAATADSCHANNIACCVDGSHSSAYPITLTLMLLSLYSTFRYGYWRIAMAIAYFRNPGSAWSDVNAFFIYLLLLAECYAFMVLLLGYIQMLWPLRRKPVPLPDDLKEWPAVDVLIPTFNEPLSMVRFTALAAMNIDWPAEKLHVYILDDGRREEFRAFAEEAGIGYLTRDNNVNAKAGNINCALGRAESPFVAIFDSDHVPTRSFLQIAMGWFLRDGKLAMLQTPHYFYSPIHSNRNLGQFRVTPNEGEAVLRSGAGGQRLLERGLLLRLLRCDPAQRTGRGGGNGSGNRDGGRAYLAAHADAGMEHRLHQHSAGCWTGNRAIERACATTHPLGAWHGAGAASGEPIMGARPEAGTAIVLLQCDDAFSICTAAAFSWTAPLIYLVLGQTRFPLLAMILAYAAPHLVLSNLTNARIQGRHRHTFWNEIYETVLAPYIFLPTMMALFGARKGSFDVTAKGGVVNREFFDAHIARPYLMLLGFNLLGLLCAVARAVQFPAFTVTGWMSFVNWPAWDIQERSA